MAYHRKNLFGLVTSKGKGTQLLLFWRLLIGKQEHGMGWMDLEKPRSWVLRSINEAVDQLAKRREYLLWTFVWGPPTSMKVYLGLWFLASMFDRWGSHLYCLCLKPLLLIPSSLHWRVVHPSCILDFFF